LRYTRNIYFTLLLLLIGVTSFSQTTFSLASDFTVLRSFKKQQQFFAVGQTIAGHFHITPKEGVYVWLAYCTNGKFNNDINATAKSALTVPQEITYNNRSTLKFQHISVGWKHYLKGSSNAESKWNLYGYAGFGLMFAQVVNTQSPGVDSSDYTLPVFPGKANFKRLTFDLGLGYEMPLGGDVFLYAEGKTLIPTTDYPSDHLFINNNAPFTASVNLGLRILFQ
jgi:hypothetical protein